MQHQHENIAPGNVVVRDKTRKVSSLLEQHSKTFDILRDEKEHQPCILNTRTVDNLQV